MFIKVLNVKLLITKLILPVVWKPFFLLAGTVLFGAQMTLKNVKFVKFLPKKP